MSFSNLPVWIVSALTAVVFALIAFKLGKGIVFWCIGGALLALCVSAIFLGLTHAAAVPYTPSDLGRMQSLGIIGAVLVIAATGAIAGLANLKSRQSP